MEKRYKLINGYPQKFNFIMLDYGGVIYTEDDVLF